LPLFCGLKLLRFLYNENYLKIMKFQPHVFLVFFFLSQPFIYLFIFNSRWLIFYGNKSETSKTLSNAFELNTRTIKCIHFFFWFTFKLNCSACQRSLTLPPHFTEILCASKYTDGRNQNEIQFSPFAELRLHMTRSSSEKKIF